MTTITPRSQRPGWCRTAFLSFVILCMLSTASRAQEWTYTARSGDNLWALAKEYLVDMSYWGRFRTLNPVPQPKHMQPGTRIKFPVEWLRHQPVSAVIEALSGGVTVHLPDGTSQTAVVGNELPSQSLITTGPGGSAAVKFADGSSMLIRPGSEVRMDSLGAYGRSGMIDTRARLQRGRVETAVPPATSRSRNRLEILTPSASAVVRGTNFRVSTQQEPALTRSEVLEGVVRLANETGGIRLVAGTGTSIAPGQPPAPARKLLPAPDIATVPGRLERLRTRIGWAAVPAAAGYRVQIATVDLPAVLLLDTSADAPRTELPDLPDGRYELRVRALDDAGLEGLQSRKPFELDARPEPPVTLEPRPGQTVRQLSASFVWTEPQGATGYRVQLAGDAGFSTLLRNEKTDATKFGADLEPGDYHWQVATIGANADQGPFSDPQPFTIRPAPPAPDAAAEVGEKTVLLRWQAGEPGQSFEIELAHSDDFTVDPRLATSTEPQFEVDKPERDLWFRVRTIDVDGYKGPFGTTQRIEAPASEPWWLLLAPILLLAL